MKTSCIRHPDNDPLTVIRSWSLLACDGNQCAASLLSYFEYWHNLMEERSIRARELNDQMEARGGGRPENESLLQYHTEKHLISGVLVYGRNSVRSALQLLAGRNYITIHTNQADPTDRSRFYLFHPSIVNEWISDHLLDIKTYGDQYRGGNGRYSTKPIVHSGPLPLDVVQSSAGPTASPDPAESYPQGDLATTSQPIVPNQTMHRPEVDDGVLKNEATPPEAASLLIVPNGTMHCPESNDASSRSERCIVPNQTMHRPEVDDGVLKNEATPPEAASLLIVPNGTMHCPESNDASSRSERCKDVVVVVKKTTTPLPPFVTDGSDGQAGASAPGLVVPAWLQGDHQASILKLVEQVPSLAQDILDEVDGMQRKGAIRSSPVGLAAKLVEAVHAGKFVSVAGLSVKAQRNKTPKSEPLPKQEGLSRGNTTKQGWEKAKADIEKLGIGSSREKV